MLRKIGVDADVFKGGKKDEEEDIGVEEERRVFLDQLFNQYREEVFVNLGLIEFFGVDLQYLNNKNEKFGRSSMNGSMKGSKVSIDLDNILEQNVDPIGNGNMLMKTGKFSKKTFNFSNL